MLSETEGIVYSKLLMRTGKRGNPERGGGLQHGDGSGPEQSRALRTRTCSNMRAASVLLSKAERVPERMKAKERKGSGQKNTLRMLLDGSIF